MWILALRKIIRDKSRKFWPVNITDKRKAFNNKDK